MEDHETPNIDSLKKEESNLNQIMDTAEKKKKKKKEPILIWKENIIRLKVKYLKLLKKIQTTKKYFSMIKLTM